MIKLLCNKCGKELVSPWHTSPTPRCIISIFNGTKGAETMDLCPECTALFMQWLEEGRTDEGSEV